MITFSDYHKYLEGAGFEDPNVNATLYALDAVLSELERHTTLKESGRFEFTAQDLTEQEKFFQFMSVLTEEVGEACRGFNDKDLTNAYEELVQCAAVALGGAVGLLKYGVPPGDGNDRSRSPN